MLTAEPFNQAYDVSDGAVLYTVPQGRVLIFKIAHLEPYDSHGVTSIQLGDVTFPIEDLDYTIVHVVGQGQDVVLHGSSGTPSLGLTGWLDYEEIFKSEADIPSFYTNP